MTNQTNRSASKGYHAAGFWVCIDDVFLTSRNRQRVHFVSRCGFLCDVVCDVCNNFLTLKMRLSGEPCEHANESETRRRASRDDGSVVPT